jgi:hypothetical protein
LSSNVTASSPTTFEVRPLLGVGRQFIRWYVDGVEVVSARNNERFTYGCCLPTGSSVEIRVVVNDATGLIRRQVTGEAAYVRSWQLSAG